MYKLQQGGNCIPPPNPIDNETMTGDEFQNIPANRLISIGPHCYDLVEITNWIRTRANPINPLTGLVLSNIDLWNIITAYNAYANIYIVPPFPLFMYTPGQEAMINAAIINPPVSAYINQMIRNIAYPLGLAIPPPPAPPAPIIVLPPITARIEVTNDDLCAICQDSYDDRGGWNGQLVLAMLNCNHVYHTQCLIDFIDNPHFNGRCPKCVQNVTSVRDLRIDETPGPEHNGPIFLGGSSFNRIARIVEAFNEDDWVVHELIDEYLEDGLNVNQIYKGDSLLNIAVYNMNLYIVNQLIEHGADVNFIGNGDSPLLMASWRGSLPILKRLLNCPNININIQTPGGYTPLMLAVEHSHLPIVKELINHGANINLRSNDIGKNALDIAIEKGNAEIIKYLQLNKMIESKKTVNAFREGWENMTGQSGVHGPSRQILQDQGLVPKGAFFEGGYYNKYKKYFNKLKIDN
jgi:hypothetical protein